MKNTASAITTQMHANTDRMLTKTSPVDTEELIKFWKFRNFWKPFASGSESRPCMTVV